VHGPSLFSLFLQEIISQRHALPRRNPGVPAPWPGKEQRLAFPSAVLFMKRNCGETEPRPEPSGRSPLIS
jgi:hypothetical protein